MTGRRAPIELPTRLRDRRSGRVVFLAHCLLNENTRYLGGACRAGCIAEVVERCVDSGTGIVQMPCPEREAWGGVHKKRMLRLYGTGRAGRALLPLALRATRLLYRRIARRVASEIEDYIASGLSVIGVVGIDGSPSCGVGKTIDFRRAGCAMTEIDPRGLTVEEQDAFVRRHVGPGSGLFIEELRNELRRRRLDVPFLAHDLLDELDGRRSAVIRALPGCPPVPVP